MSAEEQLDIPQILMRLPLFAELSPGQIADLAEGTREKRLAKGEMLFQKGDKVIIFGEAWVSAAEAAKMSPTVIFMDDKNRIIKVKKGWRPE